MPKVNFSLDPAVREELVRLVPARQRSRVVNEILREGLRRMRRGEAMKSLMRLRQRTAKLRADEIATALRKDRERLA